jgi:predicted chitinase
MQPVREAYWLTESWRKAHLRYYPWYGRGFAQLTWQQNYKRADRELGLNGLLTTTPDAAMRPDIAAKVLRLGLIEGWFTGKCLADYIDGQRGTLGEFRLCRKVVNGNDKADVIAAYAMQFQNALIAGEWP